LTATSRPSLHSWARRTASIPPRSISSSISYRPIRPSTTGGAAGVQGGAYCEVVVTYSSILAWLPFPCPSEQWAYVEL
jgi:hypothetical protein